jgi:hypothetical protein
MMKDKSAGFPVRLVLHRHDERLIRRFLIEIRPSLGFWIEITTSFFNRALTLHIVTRNPIKVTV